MNTVALVTTLGAACIALLIPAAWLTRRRWWPAVLSGLEQHTDAVDRIPSPRLWLWIGLAAGLGLFAELMIIRIHSSYFQLFAYFKNVSLLSCFLGLGVGYIRGPRRPLYTPVVMPLLAVQILIMYLLRFSPVATWLHSPVTETVAFGFGSASKVWQFLTVYVFLIGVFVVNALCFIPLGHLASRLMMRREILPAYGWNLIGSLAGIILFSALSFAWTPPPVWIVIFAVGIGLFLYRRPKDLIAPAAITALLLIVFAIPIQPTVEDIYSPYQILTVIFKKNAPPEIRACNTFHQNIYDLRTTNIAGDPVRQHWATYYGMPYLFKPQPRDVLILGSGAGNDVAAALRHGARHVDAVEIDPAILDCGRQWHPEKPYQAGNVTAIVDDARSFVKRTAKRYDLIAYGLLDSHSLLSSASGGVRLDSYVYTVEAFREARAKLKPGGLITLSFCVINRELGLKLYHMLQEAFDGKSPLVYQADSDASLCFVIGDRLDAGAIRTPANIQEISAHINRPDGKTDVSTDNWPFFYMVNRQFPLSYIIMIVVIAAASALFTLRLAPGAGSGFSAPCFFLGAGFMLVETKSITELALVYGSTWMVVSVVIAAIMIMAFAANLLVIRIGSLRPVITYSLLAVSLALGLAQTFAGLQNLSPTVGKLLMTAILTLPLFFSGFAFSSELKKSASVGIALSSNLLGAMLGGFLEYNAMYLGYRSLYIIALIMYGLAFLGAIRTAKVSPSAG